MRTDHDKFHELVSIYLYGQLSPSQVEQLESLMRSSAEYMDRFVREVYIYHQAGELMRGDARFEAMESVSFDPKLIEPEGAAEDLDSAVYAGVIHQAMQLKRLHELEERANRKLAAQQEEDARRARPKLAQTPRPTQIKRVMVIPRSLLWVGLAALIVLGATVALYLDQPPQNITLVPDQASQKPSAPLPTLADVAVVRSSADARWSGRSVGRSPGLRADEPVTLTSGMAEVVFNDGASIIIQAPATLVPTGPNSMKLTAGRIAATVPESAHGFTVATPGGLVTDYGTEFGVAVETEGLTKVQVYTGSIGFSLPHSRHETLLESGDAAAYDGTGPVAKVAFEELLFVRAGEYEARREADLSAYARWLAYSYDLRRDPDTRVYYSFAGLNRRDGVIRNEVESPDASTADGLMQASGPAAGRFPQKASVQFSQDQDHIAGELDRQLSAVTLAGWYWLDQMPAVNGSLFHSDGYASTPGNNGGIHWHINTYHSPGWAISFIQNRAGQNTWYDVVSIGWQPQSLTRRWVHMATTYDRATTVARLYVDGRQVAESKVQDGIPINLGAFRLGNWNGMGSKLAERHGPRPLRGRVDEFVIIERALAHAEVRAMYRAGRPTP